MDDDDDDVIVMWLEVPVFFSLLVQTVACWLSLREFAVVSEFLKEGQSGEPDDVSRQ